MSAGGTDSYVTVTAEGVHYALGGRTVLEHVDVEALPGRVTAVVGAAGSGRTTLVRILCARLRADAGTVQVAGYDPATEPSAVRMLVGVTVENVGTWERLSVREVLDILAAGYRLSRRERALRIAEVLALADLADAAERRADRLELPEQRRLGLAAALLHDPPVLLLDGLTPGLDPAARQALLDDVRDLADDGRTVLVTGADLADFAGIADTAVLLEHGRTGPVSRLTEMDDHGRRSRPWLVRTLDRPQDRPRLVAALSRLGLEHTGYGPDSVLVRLGGDTEAADLTASLAGAGVPLVALHPVVRHAEQPSPATRPPIIGPRPPAEETR